MNRYEIWLQRLLVVIGIGLMLATIPIFFPADTMAYFHKLLGLGDFPDQPITLYLARSTSLLYAVHGFLMFLTGIRIQQLRMLAPVFGWLHVVLGLVMLGIDLASGMPWYWTAVEGVPISLAGLLLVFLAAKSAQQTPADSSHA